MISQEKLIQVGMQHCAQHKARDLKTNNCARAVKLTILDLVKQKRKIDVKLPMMLAKYQSFYLNQSKVLGKSIGLQNRTAKLVPSCETLLAKNKHTM